MYLMYVQCPPKVCKHSMCEVLNNISINPIHFVMLCIEKGQHKNEKKKKLKKKKEFMTEKIIELFINQLFLLQLVFLLIIAHLNNNCNNCIYTKK